MTAPPFTIAPMHRRMTARLGLVSIGVLALGGCGADAPSRDELVHLLELTGIPPERAECAADAVLENLTEDEVVELVERGPAGAPRDDPKRTDDTSDEVRAALAACQQVGTTTTTGESGPTTSTPTTSSTPPSAPLSTSTTSASSTTATG